MGQMLYGLVRQRFEIISDATRLHDFCGVRWGAEIDWMNNFMSTHTESMGVGDCGVIDGSLRQWPTARLQTSVNIYRHV